MRALLGCAQWGGVGELVLGVDGCGCGAGLGSDEVRSGGVASVLVVDVVCCCYSEI